MKMSDEKRNNYEQYVEEMNKNLSKMNPNQIKKLHEYLQQYQALHQINGKKVLDEEIRNSFTMATACKTDAEKNLTDANYDGSAQVQKSSPPGLSHENLAKIKKHQHEFIKQGRGDLDFDQ